MAIEVITYDTIEIARRAMNGKKGFRALHQDFINNKWRITYVNGSDDSANNPRPINQIKTRRQFLTDLAKRSKIDLID